MPDRPEIVCICGSARFAEEMREANRDLTFAGVIVVGTVLLAVHFYRARHAKPGRLSPAGAGLGSGSACMLQSA